MATNFVEYENRYDYLMLALEVFMPLLDMFPSKRDVIPANAIAFGLDMLYVSPYITSKKPEELAKLAKTPAKLLELSMKLKMSFAQASQKAGQIEETKQP